MNAPQLKVLVGDRWGLHLVHEIERSSLDAYDWATKYLQLIKSTASSLVGLVDIDEQSCYLKFYVGKSNSLTYMCFGAELWYIYLGYGGDNQQNAKQNHEQWINFMMFHDSRFLFSKNMIKRINRYFTLNRL